MYNESQIDAGGLWNIPPKVEIELKHHFEDFNNEDSDTVTIRVTINLQSLPMGNCMS